MDHNAGFATAACDSKVRVPQASTETALLWTSATVLPAWSTTRDVTRQFLALSLSFTTSVLTKSVAELAFTSERTYVPHCGTCTGSVFLSQTCRYMPAPS